MSRQLNAATLEPGSARAIGGSARRAMQKTRMAPIRLPGTINRRRHGTSTTCLDGSVNGSYINTALTRHRTLCRNLQSRYWSNLVTWNTRGGAINLTTKSGTNDLHGAAWGIPSGTGNSTRILSSTTKTAPTSRPSRKKSVLIYHRRPGL